MVKIDTAAPKYLVVFKSKDRRPNQRDDKLEIFRSIIGLEDVRDILDLQHYKGSHMTDPIRKTPATITDNNAYDMPVIVARLTEEQVARLRRDPNIDSVQANTLSYAASQPGPVQGQQVIPWGYTKCRTSQAWQISGKKGDGVIVAVMDTGGAPTHPELKAVKINQNFTDEPDATAKDTVQHGIHVIGTICMANDTQGFVGIAPNATVWNLKAGVRDPVTGGGIFFAVDSWEALEYARNNNAHIVNMSIRGGIDPPNEARRVSIQKGFDEKGIIYMGAMGNEGNPNINAAYSNYYGVYGISNFQPDHNLHSTSNHGVNTDFTFPGADIWSTANEPGGGFWRMLTGTSMATPHASGVAALALAVFNDKGCPPYGTGLKKNKVVGGAFRLAVNKLGKFTTERDNRYGYGFPEADKVCRAMMGLSLT